MVLTRDGLLRRKSDLLAAIQALERDRHDGVIDEAAYRQSLTRFESEAAGILEKLDHLEPGDNEGSVKPQRNPRLIAFASAALAALVAAIGLFLVSALHNRAPGQTITGSQPGGTIATPSSVASTLAQAKGRSSAHPHNVNDMLALGNAYLNAGKMRKAALCYRAAMHEAPSRADAPTLEALVLGSTGHGRQALRVLRSVEAKHPQYARAWLVDGLIASRSPATVGLGVRAWQHFLDISPKGSIASEVRSWLQTVCKSKKVQSLPKVKSACSGTNA